MLIKMNILAIIPARGGSKSIPRKNMKLLGDKPLVAYPIELAKSVSKINKIIVSTEDEEIKSIAEKFGAEVPFLRPIDLAKDETPTLPVLQHCVKYLEENQDYKADLIFLLYPTNPFLKKETINQAIKLFEETNCNSVVSVIKDYGRFWKFNKNLNKYCLFYPEERVNRQYFTPLYKENGAIYFSNYKTVMVKNKIVADPVEFIIMKESDLVDIDTFSDWKKAESKMRRIE